MSLKMTVFNENWLNDLQFSSWMGRSIYKEKARCKVCATNFRLGNMGKQALLSHARGKKHQTNIALKSESGKTKCSYLINCGLAPYFQEKLMRKLQIPGIKSYVERGFSDNKDILSNNMQGETLISYRMAYDDIKNQDGPAEDSVAKELLVSCKHAHARYQHCLNQKKKTEEASQKEKRKKEVQEELQSSRKKKERLEKMVQELTKDADALATEAETKNRINLLVKSNAMLQNPLKNVKRLKMKRRLSMVCKTS